VIIVTHDPEIASQVDRLVTLSDGQIVKDSPRATAQMAAVKLFQDKRATGEIMQPVHVQE
jgi:ABC-type lipoprotein export system ATPase subunit